MTALLFLYRHLGPFRTRFLFIYCISCLDGIAFFLIPVVLADFTRHALTIENFTMAVQYTVLLYTASLVFQWTYRRYGESLSQQYGNYLRLRFFDDLHLISFNKLQRHHSGYIMSLISKVADGMTPMILEVYATFARGLIILLCFFFFTARESWTAALLNLAVLSLFTLTSFFLSKQILPLVHALNLRRAGLLASYTDFMANIFTIKKLGIFSFADKALQKHTDKNYTSIQNLQNFHSNRWLLLHFIFGFSYVGTMAFLLYQTATGAQSPSILVLFIGGFTLVKNVVERLAEGFKNMMDMKSNIQDLEAILENPMIREGQKKRSWKEITFTDVHFQHDNTQKIIEVPTLVMRPGDVILITGTSGQGKSTFLNLLADFLAPQEGARAVDGIPYEELHPSFFEEHMAFISQEIELFNLTLRENITLGRQIPEKELMGLLKKLHLADWASSLDKGLDTVVGEKGIVLSAGQKQRINLLRGLLLERDIYLLDEPTSHLDSDTETAVVEVLQEHLRGKTAIIVSHREALRAICTREYCMQEHALTPVAHSGR